MSLLSRGSHILPHPTTGVRREPLGDRAKTRYLVCMLGFIRDRFGAIEGFQVFLEEADEGAFAATSPALPGYIAYGQSESSAIRRLKRAIRRNLDGVAKDHVRVSDHGNGRASRHKSHLYLQPPLTTTTKVVFASAALVVALAVLAYELRRRD